MIDEKVLRNATVLSKKSRRNFTKNASKFLFNHLIIFSTIRKNFVEL
jgi:hypothetical protein